MKINWFTVIAQIINFLILVWLLKKFLYAPVLKAIDVREKKITERIEDAKNKKAEAHQEQEEFSEKNKQFDAEKKSMMDAAIADTQAEKDKLLEQARNEVETQKATQQKAITAAQQKVRKELSGKIQQEVLDVSRKALKDLASVSLEEQSALLFITRLGQLKVDEKKQLADALSSSPKPALIQSAFPLPEQQKAAIKKALCEIAVPKTGFEFKDAHELISGIELSVDGFKLTWSIAAYLDSLKDALGETLNEQQDPKSDEKKVAETASN